MILDDWQKEILETEGNVLLCTGRQVGKTTIFSHKACEYMIKNKNSRIIVVSLTEDQAQLIIVMMLNYLEKNYKTWLKKPFSKNITKNKIVLKNGSQVLSRPVGNTGDAVRGFTGDVLIIDEASRMMESVFTASKPTLLTTGGKIWMCSTPAGKKGYFWESFVNKNNRFKVFHISSEKVIQERPISESWTAEQRESALKMLDEEKKDMTRLQYAQEYLGLFMEDLQQLFSDELITKLTILKKLDQINPKYRYYLGVDIARMGEDSSTFEVIKKVDNEHLEHIESITTKKKLTTETFDKILELNRIWNFKQIGIDAGSGSLGVGILDFLLRSEVKRKVVTLNNLSRAMDSRGEKKRTILKEDMYFNLLSLMEKGHIRLLDDDNVRLSLKSVQFEYEIKEGQKTKIKIFSSPHNLSDIVEGLIRAAWLANQKSLNSSISWF